MPRPSSLLAAGALCAALAIVPTGTAAAARDCVRAGERVVTRSSDLVVVRDRGRRVTHFTVCALATGKRNAMGTASSGRTRTLTVGPVAVDGPWVAWATASSRSSRPDAVDVWVFDVRRRHKIRQAIVPHDLRVRQLALDARGRVAALTEVEALVLDGETWRSVDVGGRGTLDGLALEGDEATWLHAGQPQRAPLALPDAPCTLEAGAFQPIRGAQAVLAQRTSGLAQTSRVEVIACLRDGPAAGAWFAIGEERGRLAGGVAAALRRDAAGGYAIHVVDLATRAALGPPVALAHKYDPWALAADGTIVVERAGTLVAHLPDGRQAEVAAGAAGTRLILVDDLLRTVVWDRGTAPLPG